MIDLMTFETNGRFVMLPGKLELALSTTPVRRSMVAIARDVLRQHRGISLVEISGTRRTNLIVAARHHIFWEINQERPEIPTTRIGLQFNKDHSCVLYGIKKHSDRVAETAANTEEIGTGQARLV